MKGRARTPFLLLTVLLAGLLLGACSTKSTSIYYTEYRIRKGDTVLRIAERFGSSVEGIVEANNIEDLRKLEIGRRLRIPLHTKKEHSYREHGTGSSGRKIALGPTKKYVGNLKWPVNSTHITSPFGWRSSRFHDGVDIKGDYGSEVRAAHDGIVIFSGRGLSGYGNLIAIKGEDGILTMYGHNQKNYVKKGERISRGSPIAEVGSSGRANGPHLHFEVRVRNSSGKYVAVNPLGFYQ